MEPRHRRTTLPRRPVVSELVVTLNDGTTEKFTICETHGYGPRWDYTVTAEALHVTQGEVATTFPLTSLRKWEIRS
jgi:hypothetical protein